MINLLLSSVSAAALSSGSSFGLSYNRFQINRSRMPAASTLSNSGQTLSNATSADTANDDGDYYDLGSPTAAGMDFGTGDFTVETWFRSTDTGSWNTRWRWMTGNNDYAGGNGSWGLALTPGFYSSGDDGRVAFRVDDQLDELLSVSRFSAGWHYAAVSRNGGTVRLFVDGVLEAKSTGLSGVDISGPDNVNVGIDSRTADADLYWQGLLQEMRITKGVGRYGSDSDNPMPSSPHPRGAGDPHWSNVSFLMGLNNGAMVDDGPQSLTPTPNGSPTVSGAAQLGTECLAFNINADQTDYPAWAFTEQPIEGKPRYWEVEMDAAGPAEFNGYAGVMSSTSLESYSYGPDSGSLPVKAYNIGYRGSGVLFVGTDTSFNDYGFPGPYGAGDIIMFAFDPAAASLKVGKNGVWQSTVKSSDPSAGPFYPTMQTREQGENQTLRSVPGDFSYAPPEGYAPLGEEDMRPSIGIGGATIYVVQGGLSGPQIAVHQHTTYVVEI